MNEHTHDDDDNTQEDVPRETVEVDNEDTHDEDTHDEENQEDVSRETFSRDYVERLRDRSAGYRLRARESEQRVSELERALFNERLQRLDLVVDVDAVPYDATLLENESDLVEHVERILENKPYLRRRRVAGDIGQHSDRDSRDGFSLLGALRHNAT